LDVRAPKKGHFISFMDKKLRPALVATVFIEGRKIFHSEKESFFELAGAEWKKTWLTILCTQP